MTWVEKQQIKGIFGILHREDRRTFNCPLGLRRWRWSTCKAYMNSPTSTDPISHVNPTWIPRSNFSMANNIGVIVSCFFSNWWKMVLVEMCLSYHELHSNFGCEKLRQKVHSSELSKTFSNHEEQFFLSILHTDIGFLVGSNALGDRPFSFDAKELALQQKPSDYSASQQSMENWRGFGWFPVPTSSLSKFLWTPHCSELDQKSSQSITTMWHLLWRITGRISLQWSSHWAHGVDPLKHLFFEAREITLRIKGKRQCWS